MMTTATMCFYNRDQQSFAQGENAKVFDKMDTPPAKKVRFSGVGNHDDDEASNASSIVTAGAHSPEQLERLMEKMRKRAARRKRQALRSPPPPDAAQDESEDKPSTETDDDLGVMQRKLRRIEHAIKESARVELKLMNKSKKLREQRTRMTHKYESMASRLRDMQKMRHPHGPIFRMGRLPPLLEKTRSLSTTDACRS